MNDTLRPYIGKFVVHFMDDILVFHKSIVEHAEHLREVFIAVREAILYVNKKKTHLCVGRIEYLGFIITLDGGGNGSQESSFDYSMASPSECDCIEIILRVCSILSMTY